MPSPLTTHALDTSTGCPAVGLQLSLFRQSSDGSEVELKKATCDQDGRVKSFVDPSDWIPATYRIRFMSGRYFKEQGKDYFYPHCDVTFIVKDTSTHYHVPLLLSPFGFTTYRGS